MIKKIFIISLIFASQQAFASLPCPTCPKGYAISSTEEVLLSQRQEKNSTSKEISKDSTPQHRIKENAQEKSLPRENIVNQVNTRGSQDRLGSKGLPSYAPKRDEILEIANAFSKSKLPQAGAIHLSQNQGNSNLRETFDKNMVMGSQLPHRKR